MIVKNGAQTLRSCLESVRGVVDQIVIADTGSTDESREIAREFGAELFSIPWTNDFSAARNASLERVTSDWVLVLDADEELDSDAKRFLPRLLTDVKIGGYIVPVRSYLLARHGSVNGSRAVANDGRNPRARNPLAKDAPSYAEHPVVRIFRRQPQIRYTGCIHEVVAPQIINSGLRLGKTNLCIHHFGFLASKAEYQRKAEFYLQLLRAKVEREPNNPQAWMELAHQLHEPFHQNEEALVCLNRTLALAPQLGLAWFLAARPASPRRPPKMNTLAATPCTIWDASTKRVEPIFWP
jgi:glycosyltransferase involved in cell wall biosynthesis